jgi:hypothetical protein
MKIRINQCPEREEATVEVIDPSSGADVPVSCTELKNGEEVQIVVPEAHSAEDIQVGEVCQSGASGSVQPVEEGEEFAEGQS